MNESAESEFGLGPIGQIAVPVEDVERAIAFYRDVLGMRFLFQAPPGLGFFDCGGVRLMLDGPAKAHAGQSSLSSRMGRPLSVFAALRTGATHDGRGSLLLRRGARRSPFDDDYRLAS